MYMVSGGEVVEASNVVLKRHNGKIQFRPFSMDQLSTTPAGGSPATRGNGRRVYDTLRSQMAAGSLPAGAKLPSTRALAAELCVSRTTVTAAFEQLAAEGYLVTAAGRAARVASHVVAALRGRENADTDTDADADAGTVSLSAFGRRIAETDMPPSAPAGPARIDFLYGALAARDFPAQAWRRAYQAELLRRQHSLRYIAPEGDGSLRAALRGYLQRARGLRCDADQIVVVHGSQQGIDLCARLLLDAGDTFVFEEPGYPMARRCFEATGAKALFVPVDAQGLQTACLPADGRPRLAYVTPSHQFPLGGVLPAGRRLALLAWAKRCGAWIVEDDYDGEFRYGQRPIDALQSVDAEGRVIYVGTFSKALSPQLRLGYLVLPRTLVAVFAQAKRLADRHAPVLEQRVLAALIEGGIYERHVRRLRRANERRLAALLEAVARDLPGEAVVTGSAAGLHVVIWIPSLRPQHEAPLALLARERGVGVYPISPLFAQGGRRSAPRPAGLVVGYASLDPDEIREGMRILGRVIGGFAPGERSSGPPR